MRYCQGSCRNKYIKLEGSTKNCPYNRAYTLDKEGGDNKSFQVCMKVGWFVRIIEWLWNVFFPDLVDRNSLSMGGRLSKTVSKNREQFLGERKL